MENGDSGLLTIDEIAKELRVTKSWVYARTRMGKEGIPHTKLGRLLRFRKEKVLAFFEEDERQKALV